MSCDLARLKQRKKTLYQERLNLDDRARDCSEFILPRAGRFYLSDHNKTDNRFLRVFDNTAIRSNRVLSAGLMAGMTSPARPWFRLATPDPSLMEISSVKLWLDLVTKVMRMVFAKSNLYKTLHTMYEELGCFGTAAAFIETDFENIVHSTALTFGEYAIGTDSKGRVNTLVREFEWTVGQIVEKFGIENCSDTVQNAYKNNKLDDWIQLTHFVLPRTDADLKKKDSKNMPYASIYFESSSSDKVLSEKGFKTFPFVSPRWAVSGSDTWGDGPGAEALGMVKGLQIQTLRKGQAIDYMTNPPLQMPVGFRSQQVDTLPGGYSFVDMSSANSKIQTAFDVNINLQHLGLDIQDVRDKIESTFYVDLFLMLANDQRSGVTAYEVAQKFEEKMLMVGPVLERLHNELIEPVVDIVFDAIMQATVDGHPIVPPPPKELQNVELRVDFISTLAQAQKKIGIGTLEAHIMFAANLAKLNPQVMDKVDLDQAIDVHADLSGVDPTVVKSDDQVIAVRQQRQQQQAQQAQMAQIAQMAQPAEQAAGAIKTLSETHKGGDDSALAAIMQGLQGYGGS